MSDYDAIMRERYGTVAQVRSEAAKPQPPERRSCPRCGLVYTGTILGCRRDQCPELVTR